MVTRLNSESDEDRFADWANLLFEQALLAEGGQLDDPASFVRQLNGLLAMFCAVLPFPSLPKGVCPHFLLRNGASLKRPDATAATAALTACLCNRQRPGLDCNKKCFCPGYG